MYEEDGEEWEEEDKEKKREKNYAYQQNLKEKEAKAVVVRLLNETRRWRNEEKNKVVSFSPWPHHPSTCPTNVSTLCATCQ
jgi:hypothetical protein